MDTDAILRRRPAVAVVDEFAHTNVPGSERLKRWQDVHALLDAGIDVIATMNVQHLESLNDQVWHVTGVRVRETLPDWVIDDADEVVFVDLTPQALRNRLERGVVYASDKAQKAMDNFFTETNLSALREMAMRHTAHEVEEKLSAGPQPAVVDILAPARSDLRPQADPEPRRKDRILICLTGNPFSAVLIRRGKRVADYLQADCLAIHVAAPGEDREGVERHLSFARNLRIETHTVYAAEIPRAIADFARQQLITQIFMGRSAPRPWYRLRDTVVQAVAAHSREMQVIIVASRRR
jgi:two-component system sensor histidine kinase KdpD